MSSAPLLEVGGAFDRRGDPANHVQRLAVGHFDRVALGEQHQTAGPCVLDKL